MAQMKIPAKIVYYVSFALIISTCSNLFGMVIELNYLKFGDASPSIPLKSRPVALHFKGAEYDPIHTADEWEVLYPPGNGFIRLKGSYFLVSMYHQMHCVNAFRRAVEQYRSGKNMTVLWEMHLTHCLSYLRQAILCNADTSLELTSLRHTVKGELVHAAYGSGVTHECKDWKAVHDWVGRNHLEWEAEDDFEVV